MASSYFSDTVVIVTGAASGIGRELALQAAGRGASVIAADINPTGLEEVRLLIEQQRGTVSTYTLDVTNKEAIQQFAGQVIPILNGRKLILINNAGAGLLSGTFGQTDLDDIEWLFTVNFWGAVRLTKAFYPYFLSQNEGHIVNISSVFGLGGFPHQSAYSPTKFALRGFTETIRVELMGTGIVTTSVHPGGINTNIARNSRVTDGMATSHKQAVDEFALVARTQPQDAARQLLTAIEKKKQRLLIGADARLLDLLVRLFPVGYSWLIKRQTDKFSTLHTRKTK